MATVGGHNSIIFFDRGEFLGRLQRAADDLGDAALAAPELEHLVGVVTRCSALLRDVYTDDSLRAILADDPRRLARLLAAPWFRLPESGDPSLALARLRWLPESMRGVGDKALFDLALTGVQHVRGVPLDDLGPRAYRLASEVIETLADDARLREHFVRAQGGVQRLEDEVRFLRQCAERFDLYARLLRRAGDEGSATGVGAGAGAGLSPAPTARRATPTEPPPAAGPEPSRQLPVPVGPRRPARRGEAPRLFGEAELGRAQLLAAYERLLLFAGLDLERMRRDLEGVVVDQPEAIGTLVDDFALFAAGTQHLAKPASFFLVGPTGVGKNHLVETLASTLARQWRVEVPVLTIEGPNYTYPSDINELRGATRGFIRSDEPGLLTAFHEKAARAPLSIVLVDEVEKAHPQLIRFFLSILDRGTTTDAHGNELNFSGTLVFFTSNIGYEESRDVPTAIGFGGEREAEAAWRAGLARSLRRTLPPEFINRVRIVRFRHLPRASAERILDLEFEKIARRYRDLHGLEIALSPAGREALLALGYSHAYGARHLAAVLQRTCNVEIGKMIRRDAAPSPDDAGELLARLRAARRDENGPSDVRELERLVHERARARVPYTRIVVDAEAGQIVFRTQD